LSGKQAVSFQKGEKEPAVDNGRRRKKNPFWLVLHRSVGKKECQPNMA